MKVKAFCFIIVALFTTLPCAVGQAPWKLRKEKDGIQVYFRQAEDSNIKELKITARIEGSLGAAVSFISDINNFPNWMDHCRETRFIDKRSAADYTYYNLTDFPWPLSDREFVMRCTTYQDPSSLAVYFLSVADPDAIPLTKGYVRVKQTVSQWKIEPDGPGFLRLEYYLKADPGGSIPAWMINMALDGGPLKALYALRDAIRTEPYSKQKPAFIREPAR